MKIFILVLYGHLEILYGRFLNFWIRNRPKCVVCAYPYSDCDGVCDGCGCDFWNGEGYITELRIMEEDDPKKRRELIRKEFEW